MRIYESAVKNEGDFDRTFGGVGIYFYISFYIFYIVHILLCLLKNLMINTNILVP